MKKIISISFIYLAFLKPIFGKCGDWHTEFLPLNQKLAPRGIIIFEGFRDAMNLVRGLDNTYPVFMKSDNHKVRLKLKYICEGYNTLQAVLEPIESFEVGKEYELIVENYTPQFEHHTISRYNKVKHEYEKPTWKIENFSKNETTWQEKPSVFEKNFIMSGCGPITHVVFSAKIKTNTSYYIKATLTNEKTKISKSYVLDVLNNDKIMVGHGMCSGEFVFDEEKNYNIVFDLLDLEGKSMNMLTKNIAFERPLEKSK